MNTDPKTSTMLDHFTFNVPTARYDEIVNWYLAALAPLNYTKQFDFPGRACGLGPDKSQVSFWIGARKDHETVDAFYEAAMEAGGKENGKPGPREMYGPHYYGAFVLDPLGNNIEVVDKTAH
ncbi:uncharacterized protein N0V89_005382 [Didymosphaeria variabile]|uniref:Glyoxalase/bleomycin resistance protein/dioxygenase n=1 Tax=Didymosphaeria variabile TaxID=1932322 RepID=A0A9W8XKN6_9PLEO|nr:uncharacterized protein N0V89_005382 [Didymosphaeria variabile]KAJ4353652.1 hypothetical protein N0V89_005382 [Didymosphaeria variabile]